MSTFFTIITCFKVTVFFKFVLADVFFTQVTPSKQYDLLAESFDKWLIAAVCGGLVFGTLVLSQLASRKMLKLLWK